MGLRNALVLFLVWASALSAAVRIGIESLVAWTPEADYSGAIYYRPSNGSTQFLNPPIFSWPVKTNHLGTASADAIFFPEFQFQISTSATFVNFIIDRRTPSSMENRLAPFTNASGAILSNVPIYWRSMFIDTNGLTNFTTSTRSFVVSVAATNRDHSMLADETYLAAPTHPYLLITSSNRAFAYEFLRTNYAFGWTYLTTYRDLATNHTLWTNTLQWNTNGIVWPASPGFSTNGIDSGRLGAALLWYQITNVASITNDLVRNYNLMTTWMLESHYIINDFGASSSAWYFYILALGYDWLYPLLSTSARANAVLAMDRACRYEIRGNGAGWASQASGAAVDYSYVWPMQYQNWSSVNEEGTSHGIFHFWLYQMFAATAFQESTNARRHLDLGVNYAIARGSSFGGFAAVNQGRVYAPLQADPQIHITAMYKSLFPEAQLRFAPNFVAFAEWYAAVTPPGFRDNRTAQGDGGSGLSTYMSISGFGQRIGLLTQHGDVWQSHLNSLTHYNPFNTEGDGGVRWSDMAQTPTLWPPPTPTAMGKARVYLEDGWAVANTKALNADDAFTNGLGVVFTARPRASEAGHSSFCDGDVEIWCRGARVTDSGAWTVGDTHGLTVNAHNQGKINGYSTFTLQSYGAAPNLPFYSRIKAWTNATDYFYVAADLTASMTNSYNVNLTTTVTNYERHVFFSRLGKYVAIYDKWATRSNAEFAVNWPVSFGLTNLTGSNFTYSATNFAGETISNHVQQIASGFTISNLFGQNVLTNPVTGVGYTDQCDANGFSGGVERRWRNHIWYRSGTSTNQGHSLLVVSVQEPGESAPAVTRLDDNTFKHVYDGVTETNTWGTNYTGAYTYQVATLEGGENPGGGGEGGAATGRTLNAVRATAGRMQ